MMVYQLCPIVSMEAVDAMSEDSYDVHTIVDCNEVQYHQAFQLPIRRFLDLVGSYAYQKYYRTKCGSDVDYCEKCTSTTYPGTASDEWLPRTKFECWKEESFITCPNRYTDDIATYTLYNNWDDIHFVCTDYNSGWINDFLYSCDEKSYNDDEEDWSEEEMKSEQQRGVMCDGGLPTTQSSSYAQKNQRLFFFVF